MRHAEKASGSRDPGLTRAGRERAEALASLCAGAGVSAVYTTGYARTMQTGAPTAALTGVSALDSSFAAGREAELAAHILETRRGESVLVVGHSNTVARVVEALGAERPADLGEDEYDRLFVVTIAPGGGATLERRRYGAQ